MQSVHKPLGFPKMNSFDHQILRQRALMTPTNSQKRKINQNYVELNENIHSSLKEISNWR